MKTIVSILLSVSGFNLAFAQPRISKEIRQNLIRSEFLDFVLWLDSNQFDHGKVRMEHERFGKTTLRYQKTSDSTITFNIGRNKGVLNPKTGQAIDPKGEYIYENNAISFRNYRSRRVRLQDELGIYETDTGKMSFGIVKQYLPQRLEADKTIEYIVRINRVMDDDGKKYDTYDTITTIHTFDQQQKPVEYERRFSDGQNSHFRFEYIGDTVVQTLISERPYVEQTGKMLNYSSPMDLIKRHQTKTANGSDEVTRSYEYTVREGWISESLTTVHIQKANQSLTYVKDKAYTNFNVAKGVLPHTFKTRTCFRLKY